MKDRELKPIPTIVFFLCLAVIAWHYVIRSGEIASLPIQQIIQSTESKKHALYYTNLIDLDDNNQAIFQLPDIQNHVGQIVAHPDGGWIINKGAQDFFTFKAIKRLFTGYDALSERTSTLLKCDAQINLCEPWGEAELQFPRAFDGIATDDRQFLLFAPNKKKVYLTSSEGVILDTVNSKEYWFGAARKNNNEFIATNSRTKEIDRLIIQANKIIVDENIIDLNTLNKGEIQLKYPSKAFFFNDRFWLSGKQFLKKQDDKDNTETEFISDPDKPRSIVSINANVELIDTGVTIQDPADFELIGSSIYFTTYEKDEVKRFDLNKQQIGIVKSKTLQVAIVEANRNQKKQNQSLFNQLGFLSLPLILSFIWILKSSKSITSSMKEKSGLFRHNKKILLLDKTQAPESTYSSERVDIPFKSQKHENLKKLVSYLIIGLYLIGIGFLVLNLEKETLIKILNKNNFIVFIVFAPSYFYYLSKRFKPKKLFVEDGILYWEKSLQKTYQFESETLVYSSFAFADKNVSVSPNFSQQLIYDKEAFVRYVLPIIKQGKYLSHSQFSLHYLKHQFVDVLIHVTFIGGFILFS